MQTWSFYRADTGRFTGRVFSAPTAAHLGANTPPGCLARAGRYDAARQRVDLATDAIVACEPPPRPLDELRAEAREPIERTIREIEAGQARAMREIAQAQAAGTLPPAAALARLGEIDAAIAPLRVRLQAIVAAAGADELAALISS